MTFTYIFIIEYIGHFISCLLVEKSTESVLFYQHFSTPNEDKTETTDRYSKKKPQTSNKEKKNKTY
jgi:hypothetical protein